MVFKSFTGRSSARRRQRGQGMTEYIIIVALIAIAAIGVYTIFGNVVKSQTGAMAMELSGQKGDTLNKQAATQAAQTTAAAAKSDLSNFTATAEAGK